jgi:hypothetical protein
MRDTIVVLIAALAVAPTAYGDSPAPMEPYKKIVGDNVFVMLPGGVFGSAWRVTATLASESGQPYEASGLYRNDGSTAPLWTVHWYAHATETYLASDGRFLVRTESLPGSYGGLAVAFYDRGRLLADYVVTDLVNRPEELPHSVSHFRWLASATLDDAAKAFRIRTLERNRYTFDITTGREAGTAQAGETSPREASVGEPFSMAVGEHVVLPEADLFVELERLAYLRCPADAVCVAPDGPIVEYRVVEISTGAEVHRGASSTATPSRFPHFVLRMDSDGQTYARFSVQDTVAWCETRASRTDERACWSRVAALTDDAAYCERIATIGLAAEECYQRIAGTRDVD